MSKKISKYRDHFMTVIQFHFLKIYLLHSIELFPQFLNQYKKEIYFSNKNIVAFVKWSLLDRVLFKYFLKHLSQERQYRKCWHYIFEKHNVEILPNTIFLTIRFYVKSSLLIQAMSKTAIWTISKTLEFDNGEIVQLFFFF